MLRKLLKPLLFAAGLVLMVGCNAGQSPATLPTNTPTADTPADVPLPHSLYFLSDQNSGRFQIWVLEADSGAARRITDEPAGVSEYDVSASDGRVAYITENRLYLIDSDGSGRTMLVDPGADDGQDDTYHYTRKLSGVSWTNNGSILAYGLNGVHLYFVSEQRDAHVIENVIEERADGTIYPSAMVRPLSWSPDGNFLLVEIGFFEGSTLGTYSLQTAELVRLGSGGIVCCQPAWSADSRSVLVASPLFGVIPSGLWRYDAQTGEETELIHHTSEDDTLNFVNWPLELPNGELRYFYNNTAAFPQTAAPLLMVSSGADGVSGRQLIRPEYWENYEVLWAQDGSLVVAVQPPTGVTPTWPRTGPIVLIPASDGPVIPLSASGYQLRWGP